MQQDIAEVNSVADTAAPAAEQKRDRVLTEEEMRAISRVTSGSGDYTTVFRLLLLAGQRREEVVGISWTELDSERAVWPLPADRTKKGQAHDVPLSDPALEILKGREPRGDRKLILGESKGSFSG